MSKKLFFKIICTGAKADPDGLEVSEYIIFALRAPYKNAPAPVDSQANFKASIQIGSIGNLDSIQGYSSYDPSNSYDFFWYNWEDEYNYRIWTLAKDFAGNMENRSGGNTFATSEVLLDKVVA